MDLSFGPNGGKTVSIIFVGKVVLNCRYCIRMCLAAVLVEECKDLRCPDKIPRGVFAKSKF